MTRTSTRYANNMDTFELHLVPIEPKFTNNLENKINFHTHAFTRANVP